jgi:hypothetical protein
MDINDHKVLQVMPRQFLVLSTWQDVTVIHKFKQIKTEFILALFFGH